MDYSFIVKSIRNILEISQEDFARELHVSFATVNRWENGKSKPSKMAQKLIFDFCKNHSKKTKLLCLFEERVV